MTNIKIKKTVFEFFTKSILLFAFLIPNAYAFKVEPMAAVFDPIGPGAQKTYSVTNVKNQAIAVQLRVATRKQNLDGTEVHDDEAAEEDFLIYPSQMVLAPQAIQKVRIQWLGDSSPSKEIPYRFIVEEVPVQLEEESGDGAQVKMIMTVMGTIYIRPDGAQSDVHVDSVEPYMSDKGKMLAMTVTNKGTAHELFHDLVVSLTANGDTWVLKEEQVQGANGMNVLPDTTRRLLMPWPEGVGDKKALSASITFK